MDDERVCEREENMGEKLVSVIVPIYKVEAYLEKCIQSIQNQTYRNLEIILVDDGSPDQCGKICDRYKERDERIRVIHKENGGLSDARNFGIDAATGEYILFVDSDDYIHPRMVEILLKKLEDSGADIAVCDFRQVDEKEIVVDDAEVCEASVSESFSGQEIMNNLQYRNLLTVVAWNKLYKSDLFVQLRYPKGKIHEDEFLIHRLLHLCQKTVYISNKLYYYVRREGSIMDGIRVFGVMNGWQAYEDRLSFLAANGYDQMTLWTKQQMLHYICKIYEKLQGNPEATDFLKTLITRFREIYGEPELQQTLSEPQQRLYKYFAIRPQLYYNKKIKSEKREACVNKIKQTLYKYIKR